jgi:Flp pilus assembly protein TadD
MRKMVILQILLAVVALFVTGWIFFKERPPSEVNHQLTEQLTQVQQENQHLQAATPSGDQVKKAQQYVKQGRALFHQQQYDQAVAQYEEALKLQPDDPNTWGLEGYALLRAGRVTDSITANKKAIQLGPEDPFGYLNLAKSYCAAKQFTEAQGVLTSQVPSDVASDVKKLVAIDGEFRRLCKSILTTLN